MVVCRSESRALAGDPKQDRAVREPSGRSGRSSARDVPDIYQVPLSVPDRGASTTTSCASTSGSRRRRRTSSTGRRSLARAAERGRETRHGSRWSANTCSSRTPTCRSRSARARRHPPRVQGRCRLDRLGGGRAIRRSPAPRAGRRRPDPRRVRRPRDRGQDPRRPDRARANGSRTSGSAWGCSSRSASSRATSPEMDGANSTEFDPETPFP